MCLLSVLGTPAVVPTLWSTRVAPDRPESLRGAPSRDCGPDQNNVFVDKIGRHVKRTLENRTCSRYTVGTVREVKDPQPKKVLVQVV